VSKFASAPANSGHALELQERSDIMPDRVRINRLGDLKVERLQKARLNDIVLKSERMVWEG